MTKICVRKRGFTLAEVMIVLTVIGVLTAILLPVARQSMPDENLMKFKKAHNTLGTVIRELVTSNKYYLDGDLGTKINGDQIDGTHDGDYAYFCETMADILNLKNKDCNFNNKIKTSASMVQTAYKDADCATPSKVDELFEWAKEQLDNHCKANSISKHVNIEIEKDVFIFESNCFSPFGISNGGEFRKNAGDDCEAIHGSTCNDDTHRYYASPNGKILHLGCNGFDRIYKVFCIDIDGTPNGATSNNCVNECPFGYGIRADGKILTGKRADEWLAREVNEE